MSDVKVTKTKSGMYHMTGKNSVATFEQFVKSPDKFTSGTSVAATDKIKSEGGDKDYKQLVMEAQESGRALSFEDWTAAQAIMESEEAPAQENEENKDAETQSQENEENKDDASQTE